VHSQYFAGMWGYRLMARRDPVGIRLITCMGNCVSRLSVYKPLVFLQSTILHVSRPPTEKKAHLHQKSSGLQSFDKAAIITGE
jgi:hypothetical protein